MQDIWFEDVITRTTIFACEYYVPIGILKMDSYGMYYNVVFKVYRRVTCNWHTTM